LLTGFHSQAGRRVEVQGWVRLGKGEPIVTKG
jgi:hypothetical protein